MDTRTAKRVAYGIAAEALRRAMKTDLMDADKVETDADFDRLIDACNELVESLTRHAPHSGAMSDES